MIGSLKPFWGNWLRKHDLTGNSTTDEVLGYLRICHTLGYGQGFHREFSKFVLQGAMHTPTRAGPPLPPSRSFSHKSPTEATKMSLH